MITPEALKYKMLLAKVCLVVGLITPKKTRVDKKKKSDIRTWLRLLSYLRGHRNAVIGVFLCIALEAIFTVLTIASLKPVLNLLVNDRLIDTEEIVASRFDIYSRSEETGTISLRAYGDPSGSKAARQMRARISGALQPPHAQVLLDMSPIKSMGEAAMAEVYFSKLTAERQQIPLTVILPQEATEENELEPAPYFIPVTAESEMAARLQEQYFDEFPEAVAVARTGDGWVQKLKDKAFAQFRPAVEKMQAYSIQSRMHKFEVLAWIIGWMLIASLCMVTASIGVGYLSAYLANRVVQKLRDHLYSHMLTLDLKYFTGNAPGTLMSIVMQDVSAVSSAVDVVFSTVFKTPVTILVLVGAMFLISPSLTLFSFIVIPFIAVLLFVLGKRVRKVSVRMQQVRGILSSILEETFTGMRVVKAFNMEQRESRRFNQDSRRILRMIMRTKAAEEVGTGLTQLLGIVTVSIMILGGGYHIVMTEKMSAPDFVLFVGFLTQVFRPLKGISKTNSRIQRGLAGCDRVFRVLDTAPKIADKPDAIEVGPLREAIEFHDVSFAYQADTGPVLKNINLRVPAGKAIALVGETGSGKSTLVNLLPRFYDPTEGLITYDGTDVRDVKLVSLRNQISVITQDVILFDDTIANNIAYGTMGEVGRERIIEAAKAANAHKFIMGKPDGYDTMTGARGVRLSGGERQRLAIARAIVKDSPILILDEATSALDSETESLIQDALNNVMEGRKVFVIAHRLSTIQHCDEIYVIENGRFVEHGRHEELLAQSGRYARFYQIQFGKPVVV